MKQRNVLDKVTFRFFQMFAVIQRNVRTQIYKCRGVYIGDNTLLQRVKIDWPHQLSIGNDCDLEADIWFKHSGCLEPGPSIVIGNRVFIGQGCEFILRSTITVGDDCLIASGCKFTDVHHQITDVSVPINQQPFYGIPICIGDNVWLGINVVVLKGVTIGSGAVVGAGSIVTKSIPPNQIWAGVPAKMIGLREGSDPYQQSDDVDTSEQ